MSDTYPPGPAEPQQPPPQFGAPEYLEAGDGSPLSPETPQQAKKKEKPRDVDIDVRIGAATGHNGEVIRNLELRVTRRNGEIRSFALLGRAGRDSSLVGELRARDGGRPVIYITSGDGGALFRFASELFSVPLPRQSLLGPTLITRLQIEGVLLDVLDDVFLLNLSLKPTEGALDRLAFL